MDDEIVTAFATIDAPPSSAFVERLAKDLTDAWPDPSGNPDGELMAIGEHRVPRARPAARRALVAVAGLAVAAAMVSVVVLASEDRPNRPSAPTNASSSSVSPSSTVAEPTPAPTTTPAAAVPTTGASIAGPVTPVAGIVGWLDDPITTAASTPTPTIDPAPTGVPCRAQDLTGVMDQIGGASGNTRTDIVFTNRGATACLLDGYPTLTGVSPDGSLVPLAVGHTTYFGDPGTRGVMAPGGTTAVLVRTSQACGEAVPSASAQWTTVEVGLPAGGAVAVTETDGGRLSTACGISVSRFGLPDHPPPVAPVRAASPLLATIHAPAAARRGATLAYTITLVNPTDAAYPLDPCPSYTEYLTTFDAERTFANARNYRLNCLGLASIPPRSSITFEMQLDVPATQFLGDAKFGWYLDVTGPNTTSQLTVTN